jgi:hypothetical protein
MDDALLYVSGSSLHLNEARLSIFFISRRWRRRRRRRRRR